MIMKNKSWITCLFLLILASIAVAVRIYYINHLMVEVKISEEIYESAKVTVDSSGLTDIFSKGFNIHTLYLSTLYTAFLVFGNFTVAGVYLNIFYQVLTVLLIFIFVSNLLNKYAGLIAGLAAAVLPLYLRELSEVTVLNMEIFIISCVCALVAAIFRSIVRKRISEKNARKQLEDVQNIDGETLEMKPVLDNTMKEILLADLDDSKVNYIENPLPVPKRKVHKEMDYAIKTRDNDDYDLKDMSGKDFYDIE